LKSINGADQSLVTVYDGCMEASYLRESLLQNVRNANNCSDDAFTTGRYAKAQSELLGAESILPISLFQQLSLWAVFSAFLGKGFTNILQLIAIGITHAMSIAGTSE
jgi:hypothetical protein